MIEFNGKALYLLSIYLLKQTTNQINVNDKMFIHLVYPNPTYNHNLFPVLTLNTRHTES
jgi:hypothetical protein